MSSPTPNTATSSTPAPLWTAAGAAALVGATLSLLAEFGLPITSQQQNAILTFTTVVVPLIVPLFARHKVTDARNVVAELNSEGREVAGRAAAFPTGVPVEVWRVSDDTDPMES